MKSRIIVINNIKTIIILFLTIIFIALFLIIANKQNLHIESKNTTINNYNNIAVVNNTINSTKEVEISTVQISEEDTLKEIDGNMVIGKLELPKINLVTYILPETNKETLNESVTKLCGPKVNGVGNLCITGHNYYRDNMFGNLKKVEIDDIIYLTDNKGNKVKYSVYEIYKVYPKETECLSQETGGEKEVTLITCTATGMKRLIVKAIEVYD